MEHRDQTVIGWREMVGLPQIGIAALRAKVDTGARTSALHAVDVAVEETADGRWATFSVPVPGLPPDERCRAPVVDEREIRNTSGVAELRLIVRTRLVLGDRRWKIELSLADRALMGFELILGRTAIRGRRLLVNPGQSFLAGPPTWAPGRRHGVGRDPVAGGSETVSGGRSAMQNQGVCE